MNVSKDKRRAFCTFRDAQKYLKKVFDKCWKMCILSLVRTKAFRENGTPFCSPFSNFLHTFFRRKPGFSGLFVYIIIVKGNKSSEKHKKSNFLFSFLVIYITIIVESD